ncbi:MAG: hypothetical protein FWE48_03060 [Coriobacteriia bacterium]|nr:hypothetical protein [Coriobacteriia bacterium]MCL2870758.1 hypothetical protein [Coriobacteriia bacterium]
MSPNEHTVATEEKCGQRKRSRTFFLRIALIIASVIMLLVLGALIAGEIVDRQEDNSPARTFEQQLASEANLEILDAITGTYIEIEARRDADVIFSPLQFEEQVAFIFNSDMTFSIGHVRSQILPYIGTFEVEEITLDDIDTDYRQHMQGIDGRIHAGLFRISARNLEGYTAISEPHLELLMSRVDDSDVIIYWPTYKETVTVRKILSVIDEQRMNYTFNSDMTFRIGHGEEHLAPFEGVFRVEEIMIDDISPDDRFLMPRIDERADMSLYRIVLHNASGPDSNPVYELFMSRASDNDVIFYFPIFGEAITV